MIRFCSDFLIDKSYFGQYFEIFINQPYYLEFMEGDEYLEDSEKSEEVYSSEGREHLVDDGEISPWEAAFMDGAEDDGQGAKCRNCGKVLMRENAVIEKVIDGELFRFCSDECADSFDEKKES